MTLDEFVVRIKADTSELKKGLREVQSSTAEIRSSAETMSADFGKANKSIAKTQSLLGKLFKSGKGSIFGKSVKDANRIQKALRHMDTEIPVTFTNKNGKQNGKSSDDFLSGGLLGAAAGIGTGNGLLPPTSIQNTTENIRTLRAEIEQTKSKILELSDTTKNLDEVASNMKVLKQSFAISEPETGKRFPVFISTSKSFDKRISEMQAYYDRITKMREDYAKTAEKWNAAVAYGDEETGSKYMKIATEQKARIEQYSTDFKEKFGEKFFKLFDEKPAGGKLFGIGNVQNAFGKIDKDGKFTYDFSSGRKFKGPFPELMEIGESTRNQVHIERKMKEANAELAREDLKEEKTKLKTQKQLLKEQKTKLKELKQEQKEHKNNNKHQKDGKKTFGSQLKNVAKGVILWGTIRKILRGIISGIKQGTSNAYQFSKAVGGDLAPALDRIATKAMTAKNAIGAAVSGIITAAEPFITGLLTQTANLFNKVSEMIASLKGEKTFLKAKDTAQEWEKSAKETKKLLSGFDELNMWQKEDPLKNFEKMYEYAEVEGGLDKKLFGDFDWKTILNLDKLKTTWNSVWAEMKKDFGSIFEGIKGIIHALFDGFDATPFVTSFLKALEVVTSILDLVTSLGASILQDLKIGELLTAIGKLWDIVSDTVHTITDKLKPILTTFYEKGLKPSVEWIGKTLKTIIDWVSGILSDVKNWFDNNAESLEGTFSFIAQVAEKIAKPIRDLVDLVLPMLLGLIKDVLKLFGDVLAVVTDVFDIFNALINGDWDKLGEKFKKLGVDIVAVFAGIMDTVANIFVDLINSIAGGLGDLFGKDWHNVVKKSTLRDDWMKANGYATGDNSSTKTQQAPLLTTSIGKSDYSSGMYTTWNKQITDTAEALYVAGQAQKMPSQQNTKAAKTAKELIMKQLKWDEKKFKDEFGYAKGGVLKTPTLGLMAEYAGARHNPEIVTPQSVLEDTFNKSQNKVVETLIQTNRQLIEAIADKDLTVVIGDEAIGNAASRANNNHYKATGKPLFA